MIILQCTTVRIWWALCRGNIRTSWETVLVSGMSNIFFPFFSIYLCVHRSKLIALPRLCLHTRIKIPLLKWPYLPVWFRNLEQNFNLYQCRGTMLLNTPSNKKQQNSPAFCIGIISVFWSFDCLCFSHIIIDMALVWQQLQVHSFTIVTVPEGCLSASNF